MFIFYKSIYIPSSWGKIFQECDKLFRDQIASQDKCQSLSWQFIITCQEKHHISYTFHLCIRRNLAARHLLLFIDPMKLKAAVSESLMASDIIRFYDPEEKRNI